MKILITTALFYAMCLSVNAQEMMHYSTKNGKKIDFEMSTEEYLIKYKTVDGKNKADEKQIKLKGKYAIYKTFKKQKSFKEGKAEVSKAVRNDADWVEPILVYKDGTKQACLGQIIVKTKDEKHLKSLLKSHKFSINKVRFDANTYIVDFGSLKTEDIFALVNQLQADNKIVYAEPDFMRMIQKSTSDPLFNNQWNLNNTGQHGGIAGSDVNVIPAWNITNGNGVKVAVLDEGVDLQHPDLVGNMIAGYDATNLSGSGDCYDSRHDAHGTACAGVIAALNNNIGIVGVAYGASIMPVRIAYSYSSSSTSWITYDSWIADAIDWSVQNGADVLSNSWGGGSSSSAINGSISNAISNNCVVVFAAGNNNSSVSYPANSNPDIIVVGAMNPCGERKNPNSCDGEAWWGSNYGSQLDVVAPGVKIRTTDIQGLHGYNKTNGTAGDYTLTFNGTSSACPHVAAVAALILSVNPDLTQKQVADIIESTAQKVGGYNYQTTQGRLNGTWNNEMGYGLLDAHAAVQAAFGSPLITGSPTLCHSGGTYSISNLPTGASITWSASSNITRASPQGANPCTFKAISSGIDGHETIRASITMNGYTVSVSKDVYVGTTPLSIEGLYRASTGFPQWISAGQVGRSYYLKASGNNLSDNDDDYRWFLDPPSGSSAYAIRGSGKRFDFTPREVGTYQASLSYNGACGWSCPSTFYITVTLIAMDFSISPNPTTGEASISIEEKNANWFSSFSAKSHKEAEWSIEIYDNQQNLILKKSNIREKDVKINTQGWREGIYMIRMVQGSTVRTEKLIVKQ